MANPAWVYVRNLPILEVTVGMILRFSYLERRYVEFIVTRPEGCKVISEGRWRFFIARKTDEANTQYSVGKEQPRHIGSAFSYLVMV